MNSSTAAAAAAEWAACVDALTRMNGGTNIAAPIRRAEKMFAEVSRHLGRGAARVVALVTDGRVDAYQGQEAVNRAARLSDELDNFELYAFGVGRGVDRGELTRIVEAGAGAGSDAERAAAHERYMPLRVLEEPDEW